MKKFNLAVLILWVTQTPAFADELNSAGRSVITTSPSYLEKRTKVPSIFFNAAAGYAAVDRLVSNNPEGSQGLIGALVSIPMGASFLADLGGGFAFTRLDSDFFGGQTVSSSRIRAGYAELNPRVRLGSRWQVGPLGFALFGNDVGFNPQDQRNIATFAGLKLAYEIPYQSFAMRITGQGATDLNLSGRQVYTALIGLQVGIPVGRVKQTTVPTDRVSISAAAPIRQELPVQARDLISKELNQIQFDLNSANLSLTSAGAIKNLANVLMAYSSEWNNITVEGHTDLIGSARYNQILSMRRADTVRGALIAAGVPSDRITATGYGLSRPIETDSSELANQINRRVELQVQF